MRQETKTLKRGTDKGCIVSPQIPHVEVVTPSISESDRVWRYSTKVGKMEVIKVISLIVFLSEEIWT